MLNQRIAPLLGLASFLLTSTVSFPSFAQSADQGILSIGDAVVTSFSGVKEPETEAPPESNHSVIDETLIDPQGISVRVNPLGHPGYVWDARVWTHDPQWVFRASDVGQVFGVTLDNENSPNIYVTATSAYGLHIVAPDMDNDLRPERLKQGDPSAQWMEGMWGTVPASDTSGRVAGPGSIWKIDGKTGAVSLFANVTLNGMANGGAGLGNITFDKVTKQLFVSDLSTGMIHRFALDGTELEIYDHGKTGREAANLKAVDYDPAGQLDITIKDFDAEDPETWGYAQEDRRVWGLAVNDGRLFYSVVGDSQIWSVGIDAKTGVFLNDPRWEVDVPAKPKKFPVSDIVFTAQGAMILAQRASIKSSYDYANFADPNKAHLYRFWLESPQDDANTPSRWVEEPEEYAVGFDPEYRATDGGIALGHAYTKNGTISSGSCEGSLWTTGDNLRRSEQLADRLLPGGPLVIDGLQGMPTGPVRQYPPDRNNTPPFVSYMLDINPANTDPVGQTDDPILWSDTTTQGWMGDIAILRGCDGSSGGRIGWPTQWPYHEEWITIIDPPQTCIIGVNCPPPEPPKLCAKAEGAFVCNETKGEWEYKGKVSAQAPGNADSVKVSFVSTPHAVPGAPMMSYANPAIPFSITGGWPGEVMSADLCFYNAADMASGKPFNCCKIKIDEQAPSQECKKK